MKLQSIELYGVGRHRGTVLGQLGQGLTVVYGDNEAGKSTLLAGLRGVLFGKVISGEPGIGLDKGAEGRVVVDSEDGQVYAIERVLGRKAPPRITCPNGEVVTGQDVLKTLFPELQTVEDVIYQSVFTFQLAELNDFAQADQSVQSRIYTVGMMGKQSPLQVETSLLSMAKDIYNPHRRARNPKLVQCLLEMDELREALREKQDTPVDYEQAQQRLEACKARFALVESKLSALQQQRVQLLNDKAALPLHQEIVRWREQLRTVFPDTVVTEEQKVAHRDWMSQLNASRDHVSGIKEECQLLGERLASVQIDEPYIQALPHLRTLFGAGSGVQEQLRQAFERDREIADLRDSLSVIHTQLSPNWTDDQAESVPLDMNMMQAAERAHRDLQALARDIEGVDRIIANHQFVLQRHQEELTSHGVNHTMVADELPAQLAACQQQDREITEDEERLQDLSRHLDTLRSLQMEQSGVNAALEQDGRGNAHPSRLSAMLWILTAVCVLLAGVEAFAVGFSLSVPIGMVGVLMAGLAMYVFKSATGDGAKTRDEWSLHRQLHTLDAQIRALEERTQTLSAAMACVKVEYEQADGVHSARRVLRQLREENSRKKEWVQVVQRLQREIDGVQSDLERAEMERSHIVTQMDGVQAKWRQSVRAIGVSAVDMPPGVFLKEAEFVLRARMQRKTMQEKEDDKCHLEESIWTYLKSAEEVLRGLEPESPDSVEVASGIAASRASEASGVSGASAARPLPVSIDVWLHRIERAIAYAEEQVQFAREKQALEHQLVKSRQSLQSQLDLQEKLNLNIQSLYQTLQVQDAAAYHRLLERDKERIQWETSLRDCLSEVSGLYGGRERYEERVEVLNETPQEIVNERITQLTNEEAELREQSLGIAKEMGELERRLRDWKDGPSTMELEWRLSVAKAERTALAQRWAIYTLAATMIREARGKFELNHRPESLVRAGDLFRKITNERYTGFRVRADDKGVPRLLCLDDEGREWDVAQLSRGTREQVYLTLRIAVIQDYQVRGVQLPVVLDDVMVNFDDGRLSTCLNLLRERAKDAQFIYLTCQSDVARYAAANDVTLVTMK